MKTIVIYIFTVIFLVTSLSSFSQNRKNKKNKKSKAITEQTVVAKDTSKTIETGKTNLNATEKNPSSSNSGSSSSTSKDNNVSKDNGSIQKSPGIELKPVSNSKNPDLKPLTFSEVNSVSKPVITEKPNGSVNWTEQYVEAKGMSVIDNEKFKNPAQAKLMARRGATVDAQRNLLEIIKGVNITSETTINDMIASSDFIYSRLDGVIKGAQLVGEPVEKDGIIELRMRVPLYEKNGIAPIVYDKTPELKGINKSNEVIDQLPPEIKDQVMEGLTFKLNGKTYDPSMFPVIVDENNNLVLDMSKFYDPNTGKFPQILSTAENLFKEAGFDKGVEMINVVKAETGKITIDNESVKKVNWSKIGDIAGKVGKFLLMLI